jgi:hypothetical protein
VSITPIMAGINRKDSIEKDSIAAAFQFLRIRSLISACSFRMTCRAARVSKPEMTLRDIGGNENLFQWS